MYDKEMPYSQTAEQCRREEETQNQDRHYTIKVKLPALKEYAPWNGQQPKVS